MSICQLLKHLYLFQMQSSGRACLQRQAYGRESNHQSDSDSDTRDPQDVQQAQYDYHSEPYEQDESQASMYRRGPRREPYIISVLLLT